METESQARAISITEPLLLKMWDRIDAECTICAQCGQATATPSYSAPSIHTPNYTPPERTNTSAIAGGVFSGVLAVFGLLVIMGSIVGCNNAHAGADAWLSSQGAMGAAGLQIPGTIKDGANKNAIFGVVIGCCMMIPYALARNSGNRH